jgi:hypothetical protein
MDADPARSDHLVSHCVTIPRGNRGALCGRLFDLIQRAQTHDDRLAARLQ